MKGWLKWCAFIGITLGSVLFVPTPKPLPRGHPNDAALYTAIIHDLRQGTPYYDAAQHEQTARRYPTKSVATWRTPAFAMALAFFPRTMALGFLLLAVLACCATVYFLRGTFVFLLVPAIGLQIVTTPAAGLMELFSEVWAGSLLLVAVWAYTSRRDRLGAGLVLAALFLRELVLPFAALCAGLSWFEHRKNERIVWLAGLAAYAAYYAMHVWMVSQHRPDTALAHDHSYLYFGGLTATLGAVHASPVLFALPPVFTAAAFALAVIGLAAPHTPTYLRYVVGVYLALFAVVGQPFDWYWGCLINPAMVVIAVLGADHMLRSSFMNASAACARVSALGPSPTK